MGWTAAVITVSDKGYDGRRKDTGGPLAAETLRRAGYEVAYASIVPDDTEMIKSELIKAADELDMALAITTGGTGFSPRDVTPEATIAVCQRLAPGIGEALRREGLKFTERALLSRAAAGIRGRTLIVNLPGNPRAIEESLPAVLPAIGHGLEMLREEQREHEA